MTTRSLCYTTLEGAPPPGLPTPHQVLGRMTGENFAVASRLLPRGARRHLVAFYGFARFTDQIGDAYEGDRLGALAWLEAETSRALAGELSTAHPLVGPCVASVRQLDLDPQPLMDLIEANRRDQTVHIYETFADLLDYCAVSANPVGRLVLGAFGFRDEHRYRLSDAVCTGLQLVEHWQDVREDARAGRVYIPQEDLRRFGVDGTELAGDGPPSQELRSLMAFEVARARRCLDTGADLVATLGGRPRLAVTGFIAGGLAALDAIAARDFDILTAPAKPHPARVARNFRLTARTHRARRP